jgi:tetratricopeptide (TPR) repeat protein
VNVNVPDDSPAWQPRRPGLKSLLWHSGLGWSLLAAMPAILAGTGLLALGVAAAMFDPNRYRAYHFEKAVRLLNAKDYPAALLRLERLRELDGSGEGDREVRYHLAVCLDALGERDRATGLIDRLAPDDRAGFALAHVWKARRLVVGADRPPGDLRAAESHLLHAIQNAPDLIEAHVLLAQFYLATGRAERAVPYLEKVAFDCPELLMPLARALLAQGQRIQARSRATVARQTFQRRAEADLGDYASRLRWVEAAVFLQDFTGAVGALSCDDGPGRDPRCYPQVFGSYWQTAKDR